MFEKFIGIYEQQASFGKMSFETVSEHEGRFLLHSTAGDKGLCEVFRGILTGILELKSLSGSVEHTQCIFRGDAHDEFLIQWE